MPDYVNYLLLIIFCYKLDLKLLSALAQSGTDGCRNTLMEEALWGNEYSNLKSYFDAYKFSFKFAETLGHDVTLA